MLSLPITSWVALEKQVSSGAIDDKMLSPSKAFQQEKPMPQKDGSISGQETTTGSSLFTPEQKQVFEERFEEGYDLHDPEYDAWLRITHPIDAISEPCSNTSSVCISTNSVKTFSSSCSSSKSVDVLGEMLVLPQPKPSTRKRKKALNRKTICITDTEVLEEMKAREAEKLEEQIMKEAKKLEREAKKLEREEKIKNKAMEKERKKNEKDRKKIEKEQAN